MLSKCIHNQRSREWALASYSSVASRHLEWMRKTLHTQLRRGVSGFAIMCSSTDSSRGSDSRDISGSLNALFLFISVVIFNRLSFFTTLKIFDEGQGYLLWHSKWIVLHFGPSPTESNDFTVLGAGVLVVMIGVLPSVGLLHFLSFTLVLNVMQPGYISDKAGPALLERAPPHFCENPHPHPPPPFLISLSTRFPSYANLSQWLDHERLIKIAVFVKSKGKRIEDDYVALPCITNILKKPLVKRKILCPKAFLILLLRRASVQGLTIDDIGVHGTRTGANKTRIWNDILRLIVFVINNGS